MTIERDVADHESEVDRVGGPALREWLGTMLLIRRFETEAVRLSYANKIPGGIHSSAGQEGVAVGVATATDRGSGRSMRWQKARATLIAGTSMSVIWCWAISITRR